MSSRTFDVDGAAKIVKCHPETIRRAIRRHELLATREPTKRGRGYIIKAIDLGDFIEKRRLG